MTDPPGALVGLGTNLGDRAANLRRSIELLGRAPGIRVVAVSRIYETPPWGYESQPSFLNAAVRLETTLGPLQLLLALKSIERQVGREPTFRWGPRLIDLDLLAIDGTRVDRRGLTVPHPGLTGRAFVLVPLRDVAPDYRGPNGESLDQLIAAVGDESVRLFAERL